MTGEPLLLGCIVMALMGHVSIGKVALPTASPGGKGKHKPWLGWLLPAGVVVAAADMQ